MNAKTTAWVDPVITFIQDSLPRTGSDGEWEHRYTSAYQMGCEALAALGVAEETGWGARALAAPYLPDVLPRWDDICAVVIGLAEQRDLLSCRAPDGREDPARAAWWGRQTCEIVPSPNIDPAHGLGPAYAAPEVMRVLHALGLVEDSAWTAAAETVFWREQPAEWGLQPARDPRFRAALDHAVTSMTDDIRADLERLVTITDADVIEGLARREAHRQELHTENGPSRVIGLSLTMESVRKGLTFVRRHELDWYFFCNWRLADGWLGSEERMRALAIFHDPLAIMMRQGTMKRIYPQWPELAR